MPVVDNFLQFVSLRKQFPEFIYDSYQFHYSNNVISVEYCFKLGDKYQFRPHSVFSFNNISTVAELSVEAINNLVFHLGMIELISYWKASCSPKLVVKPFSLSEEQISWWKKLYYNGLGEFFYLNSIDVSESDFMRIESGEAQLNSFELASKKKNSALVPIGGGKDSPVTLQLLKNNGISVVPLIINPRGATLNTVKAAGIDVSEMVTINRIIDPQLLKLNEQGFLNGHTPFSAMLAFYSLLISAVTGIPDIALSNESSANESTVAGSDINHQYSKSFEFESDFRWYYKRYLSTDFNYFSFLRPLTELQIAHIFSQLTEYHPVFRSCNAGSKTDVWCGNCPKCLFATIILSPFIEPLKLNTIFGSNLFEKAELLPALEELTGRVAVKPFECVGTIDEVNLALGLAVQKYYPSSVQAPLLLQTWREWNTLPSTIDNSWRNEWNSEHFLTNSYEKILKDVR
ncbi:MAG: hypothetical protein CVU11_16545 [Bacteroidetes bacterium HGW-Bacteroidetes-6]|jgi:hypothetical protein|nr:MAG: hypothetical protein CVU11_16545 [Bacteroidetes bacterium HGW-Bacteroidetes-6]